MLRSTIFGSLAVLLFACSGGALGSGNNGGASSGDDSSGDDAQDAGARSDGGRSSSSDGGAARDGSTGTGETDSGGSGADDNIENHLTFSGCDPDMTSLDVVTNSVSFDSLSVVNGGAPLDGDVQIALQNAGPRVVVLSTAERVGPPQNDVVIDVMAGGVVYTNDCTSGCTYDPSTSTWVGDPISGSFTVNDYDPETGALDVAFDDVVLESTGGTSLCTVNGTLKTKHLAP